MEVVGGIGAQGRFGLRTSVFCKTTSRYIKIVERTFPVTPSSHGAVLDYTALLFFFHFFFSFIFRDFLESTKDGIEVSYNAAGVLSHMLSDGEEEWKIDSPARSEVIRRIVQAIKRWPLDSKRNINYRYGSCSVFKVAFWFLNRFSNWKKRRFKVKQGVKISNFLPQKEHLE